MCVQIVEQTYDEKMAMYMKLPKKKLIEMLIQCNLLIEQITPTVVFPDSKVLNGRILI